MDFSEFRVDSTYPLILEKHLSEFKGSAGVRRLSYYKKLLGNLLASVLHLSTTKEGKVVIHFSVQF